MISQMPAVGLGTTAEGNWENLVQEALELGYRHIDTAERYGNEEEVGRGIQNSSVSREEILVATKTVHPDIPSSSGYEGAVTAVEDCLSRLQTEYIDILYIHWPAPSVYDPDQSLTAFQDLYDQGQIKRIGVSNFEPSNLDTAQEVLDAPIFANQVECHPLHPQAELRKYAVEHDIQIVAYCPLAQGEVFNVPEIRSVAEKHDITPAQVSLSWLISKENVVTIPGTTSISHMSDNFDSKKVPLDDEDIAAIDSIERRYRIIDREYAPWN